MPLIYAAADMPRHPSWQFDVSELPPHWGEWVAEYRVAFQEAGTTAAWIRGHLDAPAHLPAADQEFLANLKKTCASIDAEWEARQKARQEELLRSCVDPSAGSGYARE